VAAYASRSLSQAVGPVNANREMPVQNQYCPSVANG